jgi:hypothetical protein
MAFTAPGSTAKPAFSFGAKPATPTATAGAPAGGFSFGGLGAKSPLGSTATPAAATSGGGLFGTTPGAGATGSLFAGAGAAGAATTGGLFGQTGTAFSFTVRFLQRSL